MTQSGNTRIFGRAEPQKRLENAIRVSASGHRSAVLISGEAGIGKTSLIAAAIDSATSNEALLAWGTCWHGEGAPGFWPWMQVFDDLTRAIGMDFAATTAGHNRDILAVLIRDFGEAVEPTGDPGQHRLLLLDAAVRWLERLAQGRHVVIVLDDLQWADSSTLDLLDYVIAAPVKSNLVVIGAYRDEELDDQLRGRMANLASHSDHIHIEGLTVEEVEDLAATICGTDVAKALASELHRRTGGHPLFVSELARHPELGVGGPLPTAVTGAVMLRMTALPSDSRVVLDAACVLGNRLLPDVLGAVLDQPPGSIIGHLAVAVDGGIVRMLPGDEFWFTHDLFRETLYGELSASRRHELHGMVGHALEARNARGAHVSPGDLALHFAQAVTVTDPQRAIHWAQQAAADERRRSAFAEAAAHLRRARSAAADAGWQIDPDVLVRLLMDEADSQARSGDPGAARGILAEAASIAPGPKQAADVALSVQRLGAKFSTPRDEIITQLETALESISGIDLSRQARLTAALAIELQHSVARDRLRSRPLSEEALILGRESGDDNTLADCLLAHHDALWEPGTGIERAALGREIAAIGARTGNIDRLAGGLLLEANGMLESGSAGFRPVLDQWFTLLESRDEPRDRYMVRTRRAALALLDGNADTAEALIHQAAQLGDQIHEPDTGNVLMSQRVALARIRNDPVELKTLATDAIQWWTGAPVLAHAVAAGALASAGDLESAAREVAMVAQYGGWRSEGSYLRAVLVAHLADAATALADTELCGLLLDDIRPLVDSCGVNGSVVAFAGPFAHAAGILAAELGDNEHAEMLLQESIETSRGLGANVWVRQGKIALGAIRDGQTSRNPATAAHPEVASFVRSGKVWTVRWRDEQGSLSHVKGLADIATLVQHQGREISALHLAGGQPAAAAAVAGTDEMIDLEALQNYRNRLDELDAEIDDAGEDSDIGNIARLEGEREQLLAEIRRATGLGGRIRANANDPAERARKAVSGRIRDAIRRLSEVTPSLGAHLDRSIQTGLRCAYSPPTDEVEVRWTVEL